MSWLEVAAFVGVALGIAGCTVLFFLRPQYWVNVGLFLIAKLAPHAIAWLLDFTKRMTPEEEADWHAAIRRGEGDQWIKDRQRRKMRESKNG